MMKAAVYRQFFLVFYEGEGSAMRPGALLLPQSLRDSSLKEEALTTYYLLLFIDKPFIRW